MNDIHDGVRTKEGATPACGKYHVQDMACGRPSLASRKVHHGAVPTWRVPKARLVALAVKRHPKLISVSTPIVRAVRRKDGGDDVRVAALAEGGPYNLVVHKERDELREPPGMQP